MQQTNNRIRGFTSLTRLLEQVVIDQLTRNSQPEDLQNAVVKVFLEQNNLEPVEDGLIAKTVENANNTMVDRILSLVRRNYINLDLKTLENIFERIYSEQEAREEGIQYTPDFIIEYVINETITTDGLVCDPSCGSGGFLIAAARRLARISRKELPEIIETRIFGCDINESAVKRAKMLLCLLLLQERFQREPTDINIVCGDSLLLDWKAAFPKVFEQKGFDAVIGNPPYVKIQNMDVKIRNVLPKKWSTITGSHNLYIPFIQLGSQLLNSKGRMGYIVSSMYFKSIASRNLREYLQKNQLVSKIVDFGDLQIFLRKQTYTCLTFIDKRPKEAIKYGVVNDLRNIEDIEFEDVYYKTLNPRKWRLLAHKDLMNVSRIECGSLKLGKIADIDTGIATLKDHLYFVDGNARIGRFFIKLHGGKEYPIEDDITREIIKVSDLRTEADIEFNTRRIIFPYERDASHHLIPENELRSRYPRTYEYLSAMKDELEMRDKGKRTYEAWYAYGRTQGLNKFGRRILNPTFSSSPRFIVCRKKDMLFCNGYSTSLLDIDQKTIDDHPYHGERGLELLWRILNSEIMDFYIKKTSYVIEGGFYCYQKQFTENFSLPQLSDDEQDTILRGEKNEINLFLIGKYGLDLQS